MHLLAKITEFVGGSLFKEIKETAMAYFPPDMSPQQKADAEARLTELLMAKQAQANAMLQDAAVQLDKRIVEQEGSAKDLKTIPLLGHLIIFLRAAQRPVWGYVTIYLDAMWFFGHFVLDEQQRAAMIIINILVLGFLFGERTIKNLEPLIMSVFGKR